MVNVNSFVIACLVAPACSFRPVHPNLLHRDSIKPTILQAADSQQKANDNKTDSKGGAGSWRAKAKEFLKKGDVDASDMKLNIAFVTGNAMKQKEINLILSRNGATADGDGESYVNLRILDVDLPEIQGEQS
jgi:hypothetical protein